MRVLGVILAFIMTDLFFHSIHVVAAGLKAETQVERIGAVLFGIVILLVLMELFRKKCSPSFFHGFIVATGIFLSFDIVTFHWLFQLHRITNGPEADWLEPLLVFVGILFIIFGIKKEKRLKGPY